MSTLFELFGSRTAKFLGYFISFGVLSEVGLRMYRKYLISKDQKSINKILFFDEESGTKCSNHLTKPNVLCSQINCPVRNLEEIISYIKSATSSLDICIYFITFSSLGQAIMEAFRKNVKIRIISDFDMTKENCDQIVKLKSEGLKIRSKKLDNLMHHKFVLVDKNLLITGSTNWTYHAFFGNYENVIITNQYEFVNAFSSEFERLWKIMDA